MKKNLLTTLLVLGCAFAMSACAGLGKKSSNESSKKEESQPTTSESQPVEAVEALTVAGAFCSKDGEHTVDWKYTEQGAMTKSTVAAVKALNADVGAKLEAKTALKDVFVYEGARFGCTEVGYAGWTAKALIDGEVETVDGGYAVKAIECTYDEEDGKWLSSQWIPDPHTACVENLTPASLFVPTWQETADENGFAWNDNPVVIGGAGVYTIVVARYTTAADESKTDAYNYAMALIKTQSEAEYVPAPVTEHTFGLIGSFNGWDGDVNLEKVSDGVYETTYTFAANDEFKVRLDGAWATSWGYEAVTAPDASLIADQGGNIKVLNAGALRVTLNATFDGDNNVTGASIAIAAA